MAFKAVVLKVKKAMHMRQNVEINDLFFELSHEGRMKILKAMIDGKKKHAQLTRELGLPGPEVSRHLMRLQNIKLIQKQPDGAYQLSSFGRFLSSIFPFIENGLTFVEFINSHDFSPIPINILFQLGSIPEIEMKSTTMENIELWSFLVKNAKQYIFSITDQLQTSIIPIISDQVHAGQAPDIKAIINTELFKKYMKPEYLPPHVASLMEGIDFFANVRLLDELNISLTISDQGALIFLRAGNTIDYDQGIFGRSDAFIIAAKEVFTLFWNRAMVITRDDLIQS